VFFWQKNSTKDEIKEKAGRNRKEK